MTRESLGTQKWVFSQVGGGGGGEAGTGEDLEVEVQMKDEDMEAIPIAGAHRSLAVRRESKQKS